MRRGGRATSLYVVTAMLAAAAAGRCLDALALLPGVHEATAVRAGPASWSVALVAAGVVGAVAATHWLRTSSIRSTAVVVVPGQLAVFFSAEAVARLANGLGPLDPDGFVGGCLQAALAVVLLLALAISVVTALRCAALRPPQPPGPPARALLHPARLRDLAREIELIARGPPKRAV